MASLFALVLALAHCSCRSQLCWQWFYLESGGGGWGGEEDSGEEEVSCCAEPVLPARLPDSGQAIPTRAALLDGKHRDREVC